MLSPLASYVQVKETDERIDYEKLKQQEKIAFYDEVILFEDELADNGAAVFSVKIVSGCHMMTVEHTYYSCLCVHAASDGQWVLCPRKILSESGRSLGKTQRH